MMELVGQYDMTAGDVAQSVAAELYPHRAQVYEAGAAELAGAEIILEVEDIVWPNRNKEGTE